MTLNCMWVFRIKRNSGGSMNEYRAQLVKGCSQRPGTGFDETFSPVTRLNTIRSFTAIVAPEKTFTQQFDVPMAFLYGYIEGNLYKTT